MSYTFRYESLLSIKEKEKDQAINDYQASISQFEQVANQLYELLKKKEELEANQEQALSTTGLSVLEIKQLQQYRKNLEETISIVQKKVSQARQTMQIKQFELQKSDVEVKKYAKLKERDHLHFQLLAKKEEAKGMDEAAIRQYTNLKFR